MFSKYCHSLKSPICTSLVYSTFIFTSRLLYSTLFSLQGRFACLRCAAGGHFVSAGGSLGSPGVTLVNYKGDSISKYVCPTVITDITQKSPNLSILNFLMRNDDVITK